MTKENLLEKFILIKEINSKYNLNIYNIENYIREMENFKVTTPIVGKFSTGKSSLINALLNKNILPTNISAETAIPAEIDYSKQNNIYLSKNGTLNSISFEDFKNQDFDTQDYRFAKITFENEFLYKIPDVKIVDMPGFDSGIERHNKAIDNYLPYSLAYIIAFSADEGAVSSSVINFLNELKLYNMPVYIVITKCNKVTKQDLQKFIQHIKLNVSKLLEINDIKIACTTAQGANKDIEEFKNFLLDIQKNSEKIFINEFTKKLKKVSSSIEMYIKDRLNKKNLSISELESKKIELENNISDILKNIAKENQKFDEQFKNCIDTIKNKIGADLQSASESLENMLLNGQDIKEKINLIVRSTVTLGIKQHFEPKVQKYLSNISELLHISNIDSMPINLDKLTIATDDIIKDVALKSLPLIVAAISSIFTGPIGAVIVGVVTAIIETFFNIKQDNQKRAKATEEISKIIDTVTNSVIESVEIELNNCVIMIKEEVLNEIENQKNTLNKSLKDIQQQILLEEEQKALEIKNLEYDLNLIKEIKGQI